MRRPLRVVLASLLFAATVAAAASVPPRGELSTDELPVGTLRTDGNTPLYIKVRVEEGRVAGFEPATEADATLVLTFTSREADSTMVDVANKGPVTLKLDLYISPDGRTWYYTSSCTVGRSFETWGHPVPYLAVAAVRAGEADGVCS